MSTQQQSASATQLNENQKRRLRVTLTHVDELLSEAVRSLKVTETEAPFAKLIPDATPVQQKVIADYAARMRSTMHAVLETFRIASPRPTASATSAARTTILAAEIAIEELGPRYMHGYGELSPDAAKELNGVVSQLLDLLGQMESYLAQGPVGDLRARIERLEQTPVDSQSVSTLERVITAHGLVELRAALEMLLERLESNALEIAVFGRVNSGKSSLLNYLLATDVLPVGVTPVTSVPLRIVYGPEAWGKAWFVDAAPQKFDLGRLPEFATERLNPSNLRHVTRLVVELPAPTLKQGIVFIDTPGLGSLAAAGAAESLAYLPRCDLGIVLVDAASTLTPQDVSLVDALYRAGAGVTVLLTKSDLLGTDDRWRAASYVRRALESHTGIEVPVDCVSVKGVDAALCDRWIQDTLAARLRDHKRLAELSLRRKLGALRNAVTAALENRLAAAQASAEGGGTRQSEEVCRVLSQALARLDATRRQAPDISDETDKLAEDILDEVAHNAAVIWNQTHDPSTDITALLSASLRSRAGVAATAVARELLKLRALLYGALAKARAFSETTPVEENGLSGPSGMPVMDASTATPRVIVTKPALAFLGRRVLQRAARRQLAGGGMKPHLRSALAAYHQQLEAWRLKTLDTMRCEFIAESNQLRARVLGTVTPGSDLAENHVDAIRKDLAELKTSGDGSAGVTPGNLGHEK